MENKIQSINQSNLNGYSSFRSRRLIIRIKNGRKKVMAAHKELYCSILSIPTIPKLKFNIGGTRMQSIPRSISDGQYRTMLLEK